MRQIIRGARAVALSAALFLSSAAVISLTSSNAGADTTVSAFYLDIGGSASVGVQPTTGYPKGQRTDDGYADDLVALEASKGVTLALHETGCSGETTASMIYGGDKCYVLPDTQLNEALSFLQSHHDDDGLVTIDLGFNDLRPCFHDWTADQRCVDRQLATVRQQLTAIIGLLKDVAGPNVRFIGVGHYDPYLGDSLKGAKGWQVATRSLSVVRHLDQVLGVLYRSFGIPMANVGQAFKINDTQPVTVSGYGTVPENVAEVCQLTWMCQPEPLGPNIHPNAAGYQAIANAIDQVLTPW
jgi:lysophospholipase L1-like esterase